MIVNELNYSILIELENNLISKNKSDYKINSLDNKVNFKLISVAMWSFIFIRSKLYLSTNRWRFEMYRCWRGSFRYRIGWDLTHQWWFRVCRHVNNQLTLSILVIDVGMCWWQLKSFVDCFGHEQSLYYFINGGSSTFKRCYQHRFLCLW